jgi:hypothetical protein
MANANRASGFTPLKYLNGSPWNGQANLYSIAASYGTELAIGDPVISSGTADVNGIPGIALGAATGALRGVIVGLGKYPGLIANPSNLDTTKRPASDPAVWYALVVDDPNVLFGIQEESNGTALAATEVGLNTVPLLAAAGTYASGWLLRSASGATPNTTATLQLKLMGLQQMPAGTNAFGAYAKWVVKINVHELGTGTGTLGV